jgi:hypothetical protein
MTEADIPALRERARAEVMRLRETLLPLTSS